MEIKNKKPIVFFNHYHNGDVFNSRGFVIDIMKQIPVQYFYAHNCDHKILADLNLEQMEISKTIPFQNKNNSILIADTATYINTWVGCYFDQGIKYGGECSLRFNYEIYKILYEKLSEIYEIKLNISQNLIDYFSDVDENVLRLDNVNKFLDNNGKKKILFSNGPALSGQCNQYNGDMMEIIDPLSMKFPNVSFILTHKINLQRENVHYTDDIVGVNGFDLNEISYLSNHCDMIIGRSSGPFCFSTTKKNIEDSTKTFICFGTNIRDCFQFGVKTKSKFIFDAFSSLNNLYSIINLQLNNL